MGQRIIVLPESIANRIAAGEIIERPASVVRELLDNAIDAGSDRIEIDLENGGRNLIRVTDNGIGFAPDSLLLAFERHATSKIKSLEDLDSINTLGFRGEALPSIASVARVTVESFSQDSEIGSRLKINGGKVQAVEQVACSPGTRFTVRNLFFNTPARKKFLKSVKTEYSHVYETVVDHAVTHRNIHFILRDNGRTAVDAPAVDLWSARIAAIFGKKFVAEMIPLENAHPDIRVQGLICHPHYMRSTGRAQRLYVNGRRIRDRVVTQAIYRGYSQFITGGGHPAYVLQLTLPPDAVDVNVHPAKSEVRFRDSGTIFNVVSGLVNQVLTGSMKQMYDLGTPAETRPSWSPGQPVASSTSQSGQMAARPFQSSGAVAGATDGTRPGYFSPAMGSDAGTLTIQADQTVIKGDDWHLVGQAFNTFILVEIGQHLLIMDQHTAHERLLFEKFKELYQKGNVPSQTLLFPVPVEMDPTQFNILKEYTELLRTMGLTFESFGKNTYAVTALPEHLKQEEPELLLKNLADELLEVGSTERARIAERKMLVSLACRKAIKAGDPMKPEEMKVMIGEMMDRGIPNSCPHGRPIIVTMEHNELARRFKR